jgi:hypothetical protein
MRHLVASAKRMDNGGRESKGGRGRGGRGESQKEKETARDEREINQTEGSQGLAPHLKK